VGEYVEWTIVFEGEDIVVDVEGACGDYEVGEDFMASVFLSFKE